MNLDEFKEKYAEAEWLEDYAGCAERWTSGLGEGSLDESVWFCKLCGEEITDKYDPDCGCFDDDDEPRTRQGNI